MNKKLDKLKSIIAKRRAHCKSVRPVRSPAAPKAAAPKAPAETPKQDAVPAEIPETPTAPEAPAEEVAAPAEEAPVAEEAPAVEPVEVVEAEVKPKRRRKSREVENG